MATGNITLPEDLLPHLEELARDQNQTADEVVAEAVKQFLVRRLWERNKVEATRRRGQMTDDQIEEQVDRAVHESRAALRGR